MKNYICLLGLIGLVGVDVSAKPKKKPVLVSHPTPAGRKRQREMCRALFGGTGHVGKRYNEYVKEILAWYPREPKLPTPSVKLALRLESLSDNAYFTKGNANTIVSVCKFESALTTALLVDGELPGGLLCSHPNRILKRESLDQHLEGFPQKEAVLNMAEKMLKNSEVQKACFEMIKTRCDQNKARQAYHHVVREQGPAESAGPGRQRQQEICEAYLGGSPTKKYAVELKKIEDARTMDSYKAANKFVHDQTSTEWISKLEELSDKDYFEPAHYEKILAACAIQGSVSDQVLGYRVSPAKLVQELAKEIEQRPVVVKAKADSEQAKKAAGKALKDYQDVIYKHLPF